MAFSDEPRFEEGAAAKWSPETGDGPPAATDEYCLPDVTVIDRQQLLPQEWTWGTDDITLAKFKFSSLHSVAGTGRGSSCAEMWRPASTRVIGPLTLENVPVRRSDHRRVFGKGQHQVTGDITGWITFDRTMGGDLGLAAEDVVNLEVIRVSADHAHGKKEPTDQLRYQGGPWMSRWKPGDRRRCRS